MRTLVFIAVLGILAATSPLSTFASVSSRKVSRPAAEILTPSANDPRFGKDSVECVRNWSVYDELVIHRAYHLAYEPWRYVFENCPLLTINIYLHGVTIVRHQYDNETDPEKKEEWFDLLMRVFDQRIKYFENEGFVLGRKATTMYQLKPNNAKELFDLTERSIELTGMSAEASVLSINFLSAVMLENAGLLTREKVIERYIRVDEIIDYNLGLEPSNMQSYQNARTAIEALFKPYGSCDNLAEIFASRIEASPGDFELLQRVAGLLNTAGCTDGDLFYLTNRSLHEIRPEGSSAFLMGRLENNLGNHEAAIRYLQEAADRFSQEDLTANRDNIFRAYWMMAEISYRQLRQLNQARDYARRAHDARNSDGRPMLLIGEMYAASALDCGSDEFLKKTAYWAAVDKFLAALNATEEPAIKERAQLMVETYRQYFPTREEIFFHGYTPGNTFRVECWINENTVIRAR